MSRLRVACIGTGFIAGRHLSALARMPDVDVVAVADPAGDRARAVAERFGARVYEDGLTLLESADLDAVWLCVPPFAHGRLEQAAVDRELPFFVEKPLAVDLETAARIGAAVRDRGLLTGVGYHWRTLSVVAEARRRLRDRPVQLLQGTWVDATPAAPWWSRRQGSGGQLVEQTTHLLDLCRVFAGEVESVQALETRVARERFPEADVPTASTAMLRFASGAIGTVSSSCLLDRRQLVGLRLVAEGQVLDLTEQALSDHELTLAGDDGGEVLRTDEDPIAAEDRSFVDALRGRGEPLVSYGEALVTHAVACAADRSARAGGAVVSPGQCLAEAAVPEGSGARIS